MQLTSFGISGNFRNQTVNISRDNNTLTLKGAEDVGMRAITAKTPSVQLLADKLSITGLQEGYEISFGGEELKLQVHNSNPMRPDDLSRSMPFPAALDLDARRSFAINVASSIIGVPLHESMWNAPGDAKSDSTQSTSEVASSKTEAITNRVDPSSVSAEKKFQYVGLGADGFYSRIKGPDGGTVTLTQKPEIEIHEGVLVEGQPKSEIQGRLGGVDLALNVKSDRTGDAGSFEVSGQLNGKPYKAKIRKKDDLVKTDFGIYIDNGKIGLLEDENGTAEFKNKTAYEDAGFGLRVETGTYLAVDDNGQQAKLSEGNELVAEGDLSPERLALAVALKPFLT